MRTMFILALLLCCGSASAQTITGCSSVASNRVATSKDVVKLQADADCFARAGEASSAARKARLDRIAALAPKPVPILPAFPNEKPIASNFARDPFIFRGIPIASTGRPDEVGAFRFICTPGQLNWDDPIIYPGQRGRSPHLHQWFGNLAGQFDSTYTSARAAGESTCSNKLNRSLYWVPALMNGGGMVIRPDYISIYYKRRPLTDPLCFRQAAKGCVGLPFNLRAVSGFDMNNPNNPANATFYHRCISPGKPGTHRATLAEAVADCDGAGQISSAIAFGDCWDGKLDSPDHRSHLAHGSYGSWGYLKCPATHPYVIPQLSQAVMYTVEKSDGEVYFSSDRMPGMAPHAPGTTFHADYMPAWDPETQATWERECIDKLLTCADGNLGDGTMMKRPDLTYKAEPRLAAAPARPAN